MLASDAKLNVWIMPMVRLMRSSATGNVSAAGNPTVSIGNSSIGPRHLTVRSWERESLELDQGGSIRLISSTFHLKRQAWVVASQPPNLMFWLCMVQFKHGSMKSKSNARVD